MVVDVPGKADDGDTSAPKHNDHRRPDANKDEEDANNKSNSCKDDALHHEDTDDKCPIHDNDRNEKETEPTEVETRIRQLAEGIACCNKYIGHALS